MSQVSFCNSLWVSFIIIKKKKKKVLLLFLIFFFALTRQHEVNVSRSPCSMAISRHSWPNHGGVEHWLVIIHAASVLKKKMPWHRFGLNYHKLSETGEMQDHGAVPKAHPFGTGAACTHLACPLCPGMGHGPLPCFIWTLGHCIASSAKCPHGLPGESSCWVGQDGERNTTPWENI